MSRRGAAAIALALSLGLYASASAQPAGGMGVWRNPKNTVHVAIQRCGSAVCGVVVWAAPKAIADAKRGGTPDLIGQQLFRDFSEARPGVWTGKVFVPDKNRTFSGTATLIDNTTFEARGCLFLGVGCRSQIWKRLDRPAP